MPIWPSSWILRSPRVCCITAKDPSPATSMLLRFSGGGEVASADGPRFVVPVRSLHAGYNTKYFHVERGVTYYNFTSNQFSGFHGIVIPGTLHDSPYVLDGLLEHQTELQPRQLMTDSAGYSDIVSGLFWLLGFSSVSLDRTRRDPTLANRSQSKLRYVERAGPPSSQNRSDSPALGRLSPGRGLSQDGNCSSFGTHPESATGWPSVYPGARHRGIRPDPQDLASAQRAL